MNRIITKRSVVSIMNERHLLSSLKHPFLVNMIFAFQDRDNLYLVMDMMSGIYKKKTFKKIKKY